MVRMTTTGHRTARRRDALSKERIVAAAIEILDQGGADALTFRALAARLETGSGAIYWHVANKNELLAAASGQVFSLALGNTGGQDEPREAIRTIARGVFDAIDAHPWVNAQLSREPWSELLQLFEDIGHQIQALKVPEIAQFDCASALVNYILGMAQQNAANARLLQDNTGRTAFLETVTARWTEHGPTTYPFVHRIAAQLREHDDREQFLTGIDIFLAGIETYC